MAKLFKLLLAAVAASLAVACTTQELDGVNDRLDSLESRVSALEKLCQEMNSNISSLQAIVTALQTGDYITSVTPIIADGKTVGYTISFVKGDPITIYHGQDGEDGKDGKDGENGKDGANGKDGVNGQNGQDGHTPVIGVKQDADGIWYWTVDGEWLLDGNGQKVKAVGVDGKDGKDGQDGANGQDGAPGQNGQDGADGQNGQDGKDGKDGVTPQLKIEDGYWYVSTDNGQTWTQLGKATGEDGKDGKDGKDGAIGLTGDSMFSSIDTSSGDYVVFTLIDGTEIKIPTWYAFEQLRTLVNQMNSNIEGLQAIVTALQNNDYISSILPIVENGKEVGYIINFTKSGSVTIYHGKDGKDGQNGQDGVNGQDGQTPVIGVKQDTDGIWYWTIDGEWLLDGNGQKVKAVGVDGKDGKDGQDGTNGQDGAPGQNGQDGADGQNGQNGQDVKDGVTPQLKIEDGYWYVSTDNGQTWTQLGKATGADGQDGKDGQDGQDGVDGDSMFQSVTVGDSEVTFVTSDGQTFVIKRAAALSIEFDSADLVVMGTNATCNIHYTITSGVDNITIEALSSADIKVKVVKTDAKTGALQVKTGAAIDEYSKVVVLVSNGSQAIMRTLNFEEEAIEVEENTTKEVSDEGGEVTLEFFSNTPCHAVIPEDAQSWISVAPETKGMEKQTIELILQPNIGAARSATVIVKSEDGSLVLPYLIEQGPNHDYQLALEREALIAIYNALDGDHWNNNTNWCSDKPVGDWKGVGTNHLGYVESLSLYGEGVSGAMPIEFSRLSSLNRFAIEKTRINSIVVTKDLPILYLLSRDNLCLSLYDFKSLLTHIPTVERVIIINDNHDYYSQSKFISTPSEIPEEIFRLSNLYELNLVGCNLKGTISPLIGNLNKLQYLTLHNIWDTYMEGEIPREIGNLKNLLVLSLFNLNLSGGIPDEIYNLTNLRQLSIDCCHIGGQLSPKVSNLLKLNFLNFRSADLSGGLPSELSVLLDHDLEGIYLIDNKLSGPIPESISSHPKWEGLWGDVLDFNNFEIVDSDIPAPSSFNLTDVYGNSVTSSVVYNNKKYVLFYEYEVGFIPYYSGATIPCSYIKELYEQNRETLEVIMIDHGDSATIRQFIEENSIEWPCVSMSENNNNISGRTSYPGGALPGVVLVETSENKVIWTSKIHVNRQDFVDYVSILFPDGLYKSSDYAQDGEVVKKQIATIGNGIDLILMGDGFSDRQIADGTYANVMQKAAEAFCSEEPYKSFQDYFNISFVNVVSDNEGINFNGTTALSTNHGDGTYVYGNDAKVIEYAKNAIGEERLDDAVIIVMMNEDAYAGTCFMYYPDSGNYGRGLSIAYFPTSSNIDTFNGLVSHEAGGHGFAKLGDEYAYEFNGAISADGITNIQTYEPYGWYKNVDFTSDPSEVKWAQFIADDRYDSESIGCYEGGLTYWTGVWRPTEASIMRYNTGGFNAPSRYAIWYRIGKLANGESWEGTYEDFVAYDAVNRTPAAIQRRAAQRKNYVQRPLPQLPPPVVVGHSWREELQKK